MFNGQKNIILLLFLILIVGFSLRLYHLDKESLWADETFSVRYAQAETPTEVWNAIKTTEGAPVGHYLFLHYWMNIFSNSEFSVRFLSVLFSTLSILFIFLIGRKLFDNYVGLLAALFLATSMLQVLYSQEARLYSMFGFLTLLSTYLIILIADKEKNCSWWYYSLYGFVMVVCAYTNYLTIFLLMFHFLFFGWQGLTRTRYPQFYKRFMITLLIAFLLSLFLLSSFLAQYTIGNSGLMEVFLSKGLPWYVAMFGIFVYALPLMAVIFIGIIIVKNKEKLSSLYDRYLSENIFLSLLIGFSIIYLYLTTHSISVFGVRVMRYPLTHSFFLIRHSFFFVPLFYLFLATKIYRFKNKHLFALILVLIILLTNTLSLATYYQSPTKAQWRETIQELQASVPQPVLVDSGGPASMFLLQYYGPINPESIIQLTQLEGRRDVIAMTEEEILERVQYESQFWLLLTPGQKKGQFYHDILQEHFQEDSSLSFYQLNLYHYSNPQLKNEK